MAADSSTFQHALLLLRTGDMDGAHQWLQIAAKSGHVRAMTLLGLYCAEFGDQPNAIRWFTSAADAGDESAMNFLGAMYDGTGDLASAVKWWGRAAQLGNTQAMYNLGELLISAGYARDGEGWVRAAAEAGHAKAMTRLGQLVARSAIPEQRAEPSPGQWHDDPPAGYGDGGEPDQGYHGYQSHRGGEQWHGGHATYAPQPRDASYDLAATTSAAGFLGAPGLAAGPGPPYYGL